MDQRDQGTFRERIARNRRNSLLLIAAFLAFVTIFGYIIGFAWLG
ncbi:MAG: HtpX-2 peptidase, partial [Rubrobacteraceae bacterium]|nr:HtpX-2 peptidase [Rubrobacteraceae bacterium]